MTAAFTDHLTQQLETLKAEGLFKLERVITTPQGSWVEANGKKVINLCANNYLGLSGREELVKAAQEALPKYGFGLSSVRFICGTQDIHKQLEGRIAAFHGMEDAILFPSCFDANAGIFEEHFPSATAINCVPWERSVACSTETALKWDAAFQKLVDPSGRAVMDVHAEGYSTAE